MKNVIKVNGNKIAVFANYAGTIGIHAGYIDTTICRLYFNPGTEVYFNGVCEGRPRVHFVTNSEHPSENYKGKFQSAVDFDKRELPRIIKTIIG